MTGWTATVCEYLYRVPDEQCARELVDALADFGFALASAAPFRPRWTAHADEVDGEWIVRAVDEQPYAMTYQGGKQRDAVDRAARLLAREHQGYRHGGALCDVSQLSTLLNRRSVDDGVERRTPGARPPLPSIPAQAPALPSAALPLDDHGEASGAEIDLSDLHEVPWGSLAHAHGPADDIPALIEALAHGHGDWRELNSELIGDDVLHQGTCYSATSHVMRFLARMVTSDILPAGQRAEICRDLLYAATRYGSSLVGDAERAAARGRVSSAAPWSMEVHHAVAALVPELIARWSVEPPRIRLMLAVLGALVPGAGSTIKDQTVEMRRLYAGTDVASLLELTAALVAQNDQRAEQAADALVAGVRILDAHGLYAPGLPISIRVSELLFDAALRIGAPQSQL